jgi:ABC-type transport system involved in multi-copper enzyme maturation permease subunit
MIRLVRAEFTKLATTRLIYGLAAAMAGFAVLTVAVGVTAAGTQGNPPLSADSLPMLIAGPVPQLAGPVLLLGILGMAGEFRHQTVTQTFLVTPDRGRVVAAKLVAYPLAGIALALATLAFTAAVAAGWLAAKGITPSLPPAGALGRMVGVALLGPALCGLVGVGVAALVRNQVAALVGVAVWVLVVEGLLMSLLHAPSLGKWLPSAAAAAITSPGGAHLSRLGGTLLLAGYALALALAGTRFVVRRDIT